MPALSPPELKKLLIEEGFEVYRVLGDTVAIADRVRDNLIMDSGVSVVAGDPAAVRFVARAQASDFPRASEQALFDRARDLGTEAVTRGYCEIGKLAVPVRDPGDRSRTLDTWYEITFEKVVADADGLLAELRYALGLEKTAGGRPS